jgi:hypothetical protein
MGTGESRGGNSHQGLSAALGHVNISFGIGNFDTFSVECILHLIGYIRNGIHASAGVINPDPQLEIH